MTVPATAPWAAEGLCRSKWLLRHRAAFNMALQSLGHQNTKGMAPDMLFAHVRRESVAAPASIFAAALRHAADFLGKQEGEDPAFIGRLNAAAALADAEGVGGGMSRSMEPQLHTALSRGRSAGD